MDWRLPKFGETKTEKPLETSLQSENESGLGSRIYSLRPASKSGDGCYAIPHAEEPPHVQDRAGAWGDPSWPRWLTSILPAYPRHQTQ
jgi:hypothetical protein